MRYPELAAFDSTPEQDAGLQVAYRLFLEGLTSDQLATAPSTPGAYLVLRMQDVLGSYAREYVGLPVAAASSTTPSASSAPLTVAQIEHAAPSLTDTPETWSAWTRRMMGLG